MKRETVEAERAVDPGSWYVCTAWFKDGGRRISGPYSSMDDACVARETIEKLTQRPGSLWLDSTAKPRG